MKQSDDKTYKVAIELIKLYSAGLYGTKARCPVCLELVTSTRKLERCSCGSLMIDAGGAYSASNRASGLVFAGSMMPSGYAKS